MSKWDSNFVAKWHQTLKFDAQASHLLAFAAQKHSKTRKFWHSWGFWALMVAYFVDFRISCVTHVKRYVFLCVFKLQKRANAMPVHNFALNFSPDARTSCSILTLNRTLGVTKPKKLLKNEASKTDSESKLQKAWKCRIWGALKSSKVDACASDLGFRTSCPKQNKC